MQSTIDGPIAPALRFGPDLVFAMLHLTKITLSKQKLLLEKLARTLPHSLNLAGIRWLAGVIFVLLQFLPVCWYPVLATRSGTDDFPTKHA